MIGIFILGRMGNQMFQYAFALSLAKKYSSSFYINQLKYQFDLPDFFYLPNYNKIENKLLTGYLKLIKREHYNIELLNSNQPSINLSLTSNNATYTGFYQSEQYFNNINIQKEFRIKKQFINQFKLKYNNIFENKKTCVIHFRRTDYLTEGNEDVGGQNISLPINYYNVCLSQIKLDDYQLLFIGDDIDFARKNFGHLTNALFESNDSIIDFQLIMNADIAIIANSSFAWWAAYLNNKKNKIIFAPKHWLGFKTGKEFPVGIKVTEWNWIDFMNK